MMKKNYFSMIMTAIVMMFAGWSLTSCSEKDVSIVNGEVYEKPEVQLTDDGAIVKGSSPADISRMMSRIKTEISDAAKAGKAFKISVDAAINSTSSDNEISIPTPPDADIELSFTNPIKTEVPLTLKMKGAGDDATALASNNKVEINIPSGSSDIDLDLIFPTSTVTLKGGAIDELTAITATNTLIIESGVTINWLKMKDGRAEVKDGGKVLGYMRDGTEKTGYGNDAYADSLGVWPIYKSGEYDVFYVEEEAEKPYCTPNLKIIKSDPLKVARVYIQNGKIADETKVTIADGAAASFNVQEIWDGTKWLPAKVSIKGEGNKTAKIYCESPSTWWRDETKYSGYIDLGGVNELSNVTVDLTSHPDYYDNTTQEYKKVDIYIGDIYIPKSCTDCDFIAPNHISGSVGQSVPMSKVTNCNLTCTADTIRYGEGRWDFYVANISTINASNSKLTASQIYGINGNSENTTFKSKYISFNNYYISDNSATVKSCTFETLDKNYNSYIYIPYQTEKRSSFDFIFDECKLGSNFKISSSFESNKPIVDKDGNLVTKAYVYYELEDDGVTLKEDDWGNKIYRQVFSESDIPEANKKNGEDKYNDDGWLIGWSLRTDPNGYTEAAEFKDFKAYITFNNSTLDGKAITKNTEIISNYSDAIYNPTDKEGKATTITYINIDGQNYEPAWSPNSKKWLLVEVE